jgi:hypothetical protein
MSLLTSLQWYWDLSAADASIVDQHSGLSLSKIGTTTTDSTGGPDGGPCIDFGAAAGKYRSASVAKTVSYDDGYTVNVWVRSTGSSSTANYILNHRTDSSGGYFQVLAQVAAGASANSDTVHTLDSALAIRRANAAKESLNVWQMITLRDTGATTEIWRNGVLITSSSTVLGASSTGAAPFAIGGDAWNDTILANLNHRGQLAMAGVWNEPLDAADITRLYNGGMGRRYDDLRSSGIVPIIRQHYAAQGAR